MPKSKFHQFEEKLLISIDKFGMVSNNWSSIPLSVAGDKPTVIHDNLFFKKYAINELINDQLITRD